MPADFFIDSSRNMVFSKGAGELCHADVLDHMDRLQNHPAFLPAFNQLLDFRQVTSVTLSSRQVAELARRTIFGPTSRRAFAVSADWQFGLARMFGAYREIQGETGIVVFREMKEALEWLSLSSDPDPGLFVNLRPADHAVPDGTLTNMPDGTARSLKS
jgi:hypothetical protein